MSELYLWIFAALSLGALARGLWQPARMYEYPYFMAATFAIFLLPQAISLVRNPGIRGDGTEHVLLMGNLCLLAVCVSGLVPVRGRISRPRRTEIDEGRLLQAAFALIAVGTLFSFLVQRAAANYDSQLWTGRITIYGFFAGLELPGAVIAMIIALRRGGIGPWLLVAVGLIPTLETVLLAGRRELAADLLIAIGLTLYYRYRWVPPRIFVIVPLISAALIIPAIGEYRDLAKTEGGAAIAKIDLLGNFRSFVENGKVLELRNAAMLIEQTEATQSYQLGTAYWDEIVWRFVPAQFVGAELKQSLMFNYNRMQEIEALRTRGYNMLEGTTSTGLGDSFVQFGFAGCLVFLALGILMKSLWIRSLGDAGIFAQLLYITTVASAMRAVTNQTADFLPGLLFNVIFIGAAVWYASMHARPSKKTSAQLNWQPRPRPQPRQHKAVHGPTFLTRRLPRDG